MGCSLLAHYVISVVLILQLSLLLQGGNLHSNLLMEMTTLRTKAPTVQMGKSGKLKLCINLIDPMA